MAKKTKKKAAKKAKPVRKKKSRATRSRELAQRNREQGRRLQGRFLDEDKRDEDGLTPQDRAYVEQYMKTFNATEAALAAGSAVKNSRINGQLWYHRPQVKFNIQRRLEALAADAKLNGKNVLQELAQLAFSSLENYRINDDGDVELAEDAPVGALRAVSSIKKRVAYDKDGNKHMQTELKLWDKPKALEMLGKYFRLFVEQHDVNVKFTHEQMLKELEAAPDPEPEGE